MRRYQEHIEWILIRLDENLRLSDLSKGAGNSSLTTHFRQKRTQKLGSESAVAKLVGARANRKSGWVEFTFVTRKTPYDDPNHKYTRTIPQTGFPLIPDETNQYHMKIRILRFFELLKTTPGTSARDYSELTDKDIEDVLRVADIKVFCDDPSFHWQGLNYYLSMFNASIFPTKIPATDKVNKNGTILGWKSRHGAGDGLICKHLQGLINNIHFFIPQMRQTVKKYLAKFGQTNVTNK